jgi:peptide-methionine (R)-S-oxide reductase
VSSQFFLILVLGGLIASAFVKIYRAFIEWNGPPIRKPDEEWRKILTPEQYHILREEGTERAFSSFLLQEKREGTFVCAACESPLFLSKYKFDSGTGWPSFFKVMDANISLKIDHDSTHTRTEYHCSRCGGHQGHVFKDGPPPTGLRYCNNGIALRFIPKEKKATRSIR